MFTEIYAQASAAETYELDQVAGAGYRKALEFLVKDYCGHNHPDKIDHIRRMFLGACIEQFIDDEQIRTCARLATWLGNDETHYDRKWADRDITDLKALLHLTVAWINAKLLTEKYLKEMNDSA